MSRAKITALLLALILLAGCSGIGRQIVPPTQPPVSNAPMKAADSNDAQTPESTATETPAATPTATIAPTPAPAPIEVNLMAVGDIMFHGSQIAAAYDSKTKTYNFEKSYQFIKDVISSADLAIGNFECTFGGPNKPYSQPSSMSFNAPDSGADALSWTGFDILSTANNHSNDRGRDGVIRTVKIIRDKGLVCVGTRMNSTEKPYAVVDVKGIKIGFTGFSFGSRNSDILNVYSTSNLTKMKQVASDMRKDGAEIVVFFIHWGTEYQRSPGSSQKKIAQALADAGVDIIFGSHPHVLQTVDFITSQKTGKKTFVAYSMGNFISNQITRWNATKFMYTEDGMILDVKIVKQADGSPAVVSSVQYLPTKTMMATPGGKRLYAVIPIEKALKSPAAYDMSAYEVKKAKKSLNDTNALLAGAVADGDISLMKLN